MQDDFDNDCDQTDDLLTLPHQGHSAAMTNDSIEVVEENSCSMDKNIGDNYSPAVLIHTQPIEYNQHDMRAY